MLGLTTCCVRTLLFREPGGGKKTKAVLRSLLDVSMSRFLPLHFSAFAIGLVDYEMRRPPGAEQEQQSFTRLFFTTAHLHLAALRALHSFYCGLHGKL